LDLTEYIGLIAGFLITCSFIPQIMRVLRLKSAREISVLFTGLTLLGMVLWLTYGIKHGLIPIVLWNVIGLLLIIILLGAKMKYGRPGPE
jgi:MtN3 and saliva related transmembrane protein